ncbi:DUF3307 domain-containing protein [Kitasatospora sp. NPDC001309]|uniref:DUF3307 domain-containing protein n=1 Tax=Kitasatospora sp. NPDC001309 TaxID=3364013 RepID=UPI003686F346
MKDAAGILAFVLLTAHWLADYPFQTDAQAKRKAGWTEGDKDPHPGRHHHGWGANLAHAATHVITSAALLLVAAAVLDLRPSLPAAAGALVWLGVSHSVIDRRWPVARWMSWARQAGFAAHGGAAHVDQTAHVALGILPAVLLIAGLS